MAAATPRFFAAAPLFRNWLAANAATAPELLVGFHKVGSGRPSMSWPESVDEALCVGWIDGVRKRIDEASYSIRFTPRKPTSIWNAVNIAKFAQLSAQGRVGAAGKRAYGHRSEARSVVYAYEQERTAMLAAEEERAFRQRGSAWAFFGSTPPGYQKVMLHFVTSAKRAETRSSRLIPLVEACAVGKRLR